MLIATHDGSFHADEVFAIAALGLLGEPLEVMRTRDRDALARADLRVDVGFRHDPSTGDFDHHQREFRRGARQRRPLRLVRPDLAGVRRPDLRRRPGGRRRGRRQPRAGGGRQRHRPAAHRDAGRRRPPADRQWRHRAASTRRWDETLTPEQERLRFDEAVELARGILAREVLSAASGRRARRASCRRRSPRRPIHAWSSCPSTPRGSRSWSPMRPRPSMSSIPSARALAWKRSRASWAPSRTAVTCPPRGAGWRATISSRPPACPTRVLPRQAVSGGGLVSRRDRALARLALAED